MRLSRRQRGVWWAIATALVFTGVSAFMLWIDHGDDEIYVPGRLETGLSSELSRDLPEDYPRITFSDVTAMAGIAFHHFPATRTSRLPEDMGSGAAWGDYDGDGWIDLFVVNFPHSLDSPADHSQSDQHRSHLYHNLGDGTFEEVAEEAGIAFSGLGMGASWADYDDDGHLDLIITGYGSNHLYRNLGDGQFREVSVEAGISDRDGFWVGSSWGDYDRDGFLDLYVSGYVDYREDLPATTSYQYEVASPASINPSSFAPIPNLLYHNQGDGTFEEVALKSGVSNDNGRSLSATWVDLDQDGYLDLYVANDVSDNALYHNQGNGLFEDISYTALVADYRGAMGIAAGDWNADGDQDLFVTHWLAQENALYENTMVERSGSGPPSDVRFMDVADRYGVGQIALDYVGWGTGFWDYDNDGQLDLFVVNGSTLQEKESPEQMIAMPDQVFWNRGPDEGFFDVSRVSGDYFAEEHVGRGAAMADYDNDGDLDLFVVNHGGSAVLLRNDGGNEQNWLQVDIRGRNGSSPAPGATIRIKAGEQQWLRQVGAQASYASQHTLIEHFGLGRRTAVDSIEVVWPTGEHHLVTSVQANQRIRVQPEVPS